MILLLLFFVFLSFVVLVLIGVDKFVQWDEGRRWEREKSERDASIARDVAEYRKKRFYHE
jgi:hypothetical protein